MPVPVVLCRIILAAVVGNFIVATTLAVGPALAICRLRPSSLLRSE